MKGEKMVSGHILVANNKNTSMTGKKKKKLGSGEMMSFPWYKMTRKTNCKDS